MLRHGCRSHDDYWSFFRLSIFVENLEQCSPQAADLGAKGDTLLSKQVRLVKGGGPKGAFVGAAQEHDQNVWVISKKLMTPKDVNCA